MSIKYYKTTPRGYYETSQIYFMLKDDIYYKWYFGRGWGFYVIKSKYHYMPRLKEITKKELFMACL